MTAAYFEDHPTDPDKVIMRKPRLDQGPDYERGFIDGMMYQTQTTVNRAVDAMSKPKRNEVLEEVAREIEKMKAFGPDTVASFASYIRDMKDAKTKTS
jgi:hypothetical protein